MKIAVIGAGEMGCYFGGLLARFADLTFVAEDSTFEAVKQGGVKITTTKEELHISPIQVVDSVEQLLEPDLILLCAKSYQAAGLAFELRKILREDAVILSLQQGAMIDENLLSIVGKGRLFPAVSHVLLEERAPGHVVQSGGPLTLFLGSRTESEFPALRRIAVFLRSCGIDTSVTKNIEHELWRALISSATLAGLTALCRCSVAELLEDKDLEDLYRSAVIEAVMVAHAYGAPVAFDLASRIMDLTRYCRNSSYSSPFLRDLEAGRRTEVIHLNGTIVEMAKKAEVPAPLHSLIYHSVRAQSELAK